MLYFFGWKFNQRDACRSDGVIPSHHAIRCFNRDEAVRDPAADVLRGLRLKISIEDFFSAVKRLEPVVYFNSIIIALPIPRSSSSVCVRSPLLKRMSKAW